MEAIEKIKDFWPDWNIEELLGRGSYGKVFSAARSDAGKKYYSAIKVMTIPASPEEIELVRAEGLDEKSTREYFHEIVQGCIQEITMMMDYRGTANIVNVEDYKVIEHKDSIGWDIFIRMERLLCLKEIMKLRRLEEDEIIDLGIGISAALIDCETDDVIHRDIKPANIFLHQKTGVYKLGDFGIATRMSRAERGMSCKGTYDYMAPEIFTSDTYDQTVDIYALGLVLYRLCNENKGPFIDLGAGTMRPSDAERANGLRLSGTELPAPAHASADLAKIIGKAVRFRPEERYRDAKEMNAALEELKLKRRLAKNGAGREKHSVNDLSDRDTERSLTDLPGGRDYRTAYDMPGRNRAVRADNVQIPVNVQSGGSAYSSPTNAPARNTAYGYSSPTNAPARNTAYGGAPNAQSGGSAYSSPTNAPARNTAYGVAPNAQSGSSAYSSPTSVSSRNTAYSGTPNAQSGGSAYSSPTNVSSRNTAYGVAPNVQSGSSAYSSPTGVSSRNTAYSGIPNAQSGGRAYSSPTNAPAGNTAYSGAPNAQSGGSAYSSPENQIPGSRVPESWISQMENTQKLGSQSGAVPQSDAGGSVQESIAAERSSYIPPAPLKQPGGSERRQRESGISQGEDEPHSGNVRGMIAAALLGIALGLILILAGLFLFRDRIESLINGYDVTDPSNVVSSSTAVNPYKPIDDSVKSNSDASEENPAPAAQFISLKEIEKVNPEVTPTSLVYLDSARDNFGTTYKNAIAGGTSEMENADEYILDGKYRSIAGRVVMNYDKRANVGKDTYVRIYGDGNLLWESGRVTRGFVPQDFQVNITGVSRMKLTIQGCNFIRLVDCVISEEETITGNSTAEGIIDNIVSGDHAEISEIDWYSSSMQLSPSEGGLVFYGNAVDNNGTVYNSTAIGGRAADTENWNSYKISGAYSSITGKVILNNAYSDVVSESTRFRIYADGEVVYESQPVTAGRGPQEFNVNLKGVEDLRLEVFGANYMRVVDCTLNK